MWPMLRTLRRVRPVLRPLWPALLPPPALLRALLQVLQSLHHHLHLLHEDFVNTHQYAGVDDRHFLHRTGVRRAEGTGWCIRPKLFAGPMSGACTHIHPAKNTVRYPVRKTDVYKRS
ncbi:hypothetical protein JYU34_003835 [Plutella xylostella]|uniref:Secreted protein n=1 Tax=Plutella xylostella TaxID=51655 RepID=A0ABQ7R117_PLUXY|nr:hypothetical protein JYU34_003835 [Plutella xylostella]